MKIAVGGKVVQEKVDCTCMLKCSVFTLFLHYFSI